MTHPFQANFEIDNFSHPREQHMILLVEPCEEVFLQIVARLAEAGISVVRARNAGEAYLLADSLVVANVDLPDQSGWFLASQLQFKKPSTRLWLYQPDFNNFEIGMASCLQVRELLEYGEDLSSLPAQLKALLKNTLSLGHSGARFSKVI